METTKELKDLLIQRTSEARQALYDAQTKVSEFMYALLENGMESSDLEIKILEGIIGDLYNQVTANQNVYKSLVKRRIIKLY